MTTQLIHEFMFSMLQNNVSKNGILQGRGQTTTNALERTAITLGKIARAITPAIAQTDNVDNQRHCRAAYRAGMSYVSTICEASPFKSLPKHLRETLAVGPEHPAGGNQP
ncbi:hypothetical protein LAV84_27280 [Rhizobium sp. VS19-DR104.2]|uniref:hypothetical protein n=1 Tax=unclassified Rhizobium TaxID=2613769 RepID=UPI001C5B1E6D|nr:MULTISPECIES: hypothetical protein [unclassified Rhizobium]MBZ5763282.1 hypothetical protein [Rhizobium sp. VS19-DR96]MBZ5769681.1 hypothetical protein [Rhizobium sp. VS19-DR129.2]MBZ5777216.1 hypothetical protein [Rhizobium sp. VS19-DRK62.2]MBZ5787847.1 hypothetical protein [Rhizobium sp. VS19-DR121]MBZ5805340.1 hypothetical protein [Rhizobium sp. VS19-DR181]